MVLTLFLLKEAANHSFLVVMIPCFQMTQYTSLVLLEKSPHSVNQSTVKRDVKNKSFVNNKNSFVVKLFYFVLLRDYTLSISEKSTSTLVVLPKKTVSISTAPVSLLIETILPSVPSRVPLMTLM